MFTLLSDVSPVSPRYVCSSCGQSARCGTWKYIHCMSRKYKLVNNNFTRNEVMSFLRQAKVQPLCFFLKKIGSFFVNQILYNWQYLYPHQQ